MPVDWLELDTLAEAEGVIRDHPHHFVAVDAAWSDQIHTHYVKARKADLRDLVRAWFRSDNDERDNGSKPTLSYAEAGDGDVYWLPIRGNS